MTEPFDPKTEEPGDFTAEELEMAARLKEQLDASRGALEPEMAPLIEQAALLRSVSDFELREEQHTRGLSEVLRLAEKKSRSAPQKTKPQGQSLFRRLLVWSPLPAVALLTVVYVTGNRGDTRVPQEIQSFDYVGTAAPRDSARDDAGVDSAGPGVLAETLQEAKGEAAEGSMKRTAVKRKSAPGAPSAPRFEEKVDSAHSLDSSQVLKAQATLLASRMDEQDVRAQQSNLELEMRGYRAHLLARLEESER